MLAFAIVVLLLLPLSGTQLPTTETNLWTIKHGLIFDAKGKDVGVYGVDIPVSTLRR